MNDLDNAVLWMIAADRRCMGSAGASMSLLQLSGIANAYVPPEVLRLRRAQKYAADVRARRPEMQVKKVAT